MVPASDNDSRKAEEITELVHEIRERVRARYPDSSAANGSIAVPDLMPLVHARDAADRVGTRRRIGGGNRVGDEDRPLGAFRADHRAYRGARQMVSVDNKAG